MEKVSFEVKDQTQSGLGSQLLDFGGDTRFVSFDNFHFLISPVYVLKLVDFTSADQDLKTFNTIIMIMIIVIMKYHDHDHILAESQFA